MNIPIVLYDENHERVGETYHRRAKQLVRSGRAVWLEEGHSLQMAPYQIPALPQSKEALPTMEGIYTNNGPIPPQPTEAPGATGHNELLMYLARQNVARKRNLVKNLVAYALAWLALIIFGFVAFAGPASSSASADAAVVIGNSGIHGHRDIVYIQPFPQEISGYPFRFHRFGDRLEAYIFENVQGHITNALESFTIVPWTAPTFNTVQLHTTANYSVMLPEMTETLHYNYFWFFAMGILVAWGVWILARGLQVTRQHMQSRPKKISRPDPIAMEYQRLSQMDGQ